MPGERDLPPTPPDRGEGASAASVDWSALVSRFGHGRDSALGELVVREAPRLLARIEAALPAQIRARVGASDIFQQTLIDLMRVQERFDDRGAAAFRKMMLTMAEARIARAIRRERARKRDVLREVEPPAGFGGDSVAPRPWEAVAGDIATPSKIARGQESSARVRDALGQLPPADREIISLIDYDEIGYEAAAERLGIAVKAAQKRHSRALERLRALLRSSGDDSLPGG